MTREECIKRLEYTKLRMKDATYSPETQEALGMAIRSLEAWDYIIEDIRNRGGEFFSADIRGNFYMNTLKYHKRYNVEKELQEFLDRIKKEKEYYDSLSPEEKAEYDKKKTEERKRINDILSTSALVSSMTKQEY